VAALGTLVLLGGIVGAAVGTIGYQTGLKGNQKELSLGGLVAGLIVLFVSFLIGGWVAARIARYAGSRHGLVAVLWMIVLAVLLALLGAWLGTQHNVFRSLGLPQWFSSNALATGAIIGGIVSIAATLLGGWLGGRLGDRDGCDRNVELVETREQAHSRPVAF
jgi:MFS family permease